MTGRAPGWPQAPEFLTFALALLRVLAVFVGLSIGFRVFVLAWGALVHFIGAP